MCGIAGYLTFQKEAPSQAIVKKMCNTIAHRGPDDEGYFNDDNLSFGMRRLSIIDLKGGHQPIANEDESLWLICNGEIYNFLKLKDDLIEQGHRFKTSSDVEVILHLYERYGFDFVNYLNGMFAIALWDKNKELLILARDRLGKKPLYYTDANGVLIFASELKALLEHPKVVKELDYNSLSRFLTYEYIPSPCSIFKNINKLLPGHMLIKSNNKVVVKQYWDAQFNPTNLSKQELLDELDKRLLKSTEMRLISDVPLGVFLSGGLDSSTIAYYMCQLSDKVKSFSIGFDDPSFDESKYARQVAKHLGTEHHEQILEAQDLYDLVPHIGDMLDEPLADASIFPTYLLSKFTKEKVTVALGGDGGDELFMGYPTFQADRLANIYGRIPSVLRRGLIEPAISKLPTSYDNLSVDFKLKKFADGLKHPKELRQQLWLGSFSEDDKSLLINSDVKQQIKTDVLLGDLLLFPHLKHQSYWNKVIYLYLKQYLLDDILVKVDRASMFTSLEVRAPFLDFSLVDFVNSFPAKYKLKGFRTKYLLKKLMESKLPDNIINRSKKGFGIPVAKWIRGPLKEFSLEMLGKKKLQDQGIFNYPYVKALLDQHMAGKKDNRKFLWTLISFQIWYERWAA